MNSQFELGPDCCLLRTFPKCPGTFLGIANSGGPVDTAIIPMLLLALTGSQSLRPYFWTSSFIAQSEKYFDLERCLTCLDWQI